jgi:hypothetical protein
VRRGLLTLAALWAAVCCCTGAGSAAALGHRHSHGVVLRVMTVNMAGGEWASSTVTAPARQRPTRGAVVAAIRAARADVVGLPEPFGRTRLIAHTLGPSWHAYPRLHTVRSRPNPGARARCHDGHRRGRDSRRARPAERHRVDARPQRSGRELQAPVAKRVFAVGEPISVSWRNDPGNRYDWLSVNARNGTPLTLDLLEWRYVAAVDGQGTIGKRDHGDWPLPAGRSRVWLCLDDGYVCWDSATFTVR